MTSGESLQCPTTDTCPAVLYCNRLVRQIGVLQASTKHIAILKQWAQHPAPSAATAALIESILQEVHLNEALQDASANNLLAKGTTEPVTASTQEVAAKTRERLVEAGVSYTDFVAFMGRRALYKFGSDIALLEESYDTSESVLQLSELIQGFDIPTTQSVCVSGVLESTMDDGLPAIQCGSLNLSDELRQRSELPYFSI